MKRIIVIGEGQTEQSFCNDLLQSHFNKKSIYIENPTIKKTHGGIVNWEALKFQIKNHNAPYYNSQRNKCIGHKMEIS